MYGLGPERKTGGWPPLSSEQIKNIAWLTTQPKICAVALMLELTSCLSRLLDHAPLSPYRCGKSVRAIKELVAKFGRNPDEFARHSLHVGGATTKNGRRRHTETSTLVSVSSHAMWTTQDKPRL